MEAEEGMRVEERTEMSIQSRGKRVEGGKNPFTPCNNPTMNMNQDPGQGNQDKDPNAITA